MPPLRIATANLENLDDHPEDEPPLTVRLPYLKAGLNRLRADIVCLQEIHGQDLPGGGRELTALDRVLEGTPYERFERASTETADGIPYRQRNLVVLSRFPIRAHQQIKHRFAPPPLYRQVTAQPEQPEAKRVEWERPILHCEIELDPHRVLHVIVVHLKSRMPSPIDGQGPERFMWKSAAGWAEGYFISSMKRVGQAFELRAVIDTLFDADEEALITVVGDFNSDVTEVPVLAILGRVEDTGNTELGPRVLLPCEQTVPEPSRYSLFHQGKPNMLDHILVSRPLLQFYRSTEIHNETLHDESIAFATDVQYPEPDHAPIVAEFDLTA